MFQMTSFEESFLNGTNKGKRKYIPTQIIKIGDEILKVRRNTTDKNAAESAAEIDLDTHYLTWQPVLEYPASSGSSGNALDQETSRGFTDSVRSNKAKREHNETSSGNEKNDTLVLGELVVATTVNSTTVNMSQTTVDPDIKLKMSLMGEFVKKEEKKDGPPYEFVKPDLSDAVTKAIEAEIKEPILAATTPRHPRSSKQEKWQPEVELNPPSMGATETWHLWDSNASNRRIKNMDFEKNTTSSGSLSALTIQFLPQRLISFLEQAEKYARIAFSPFLSNDSESRNQRRTRFLPQFLWGYNDERKEKKLETESKDETSTRNSSELVVAVPYKDDKAEFKPKYIPLASSENEDKVEKAETDFNRPTMIKEHLEEPIVEETEEEKKER